MSVLLSVPPGVHQRTLPGRREHREARTKPACVCIGEGRLCESRKSQNVTGGNSEATESTNSPLASPLNMRLFLSLCNQGDFDAANLNLGLVREMGRRKVRTASPFAVYR